MGGGSEFKRFLHCCLEPLLIFICKNTFTFTNIVSILFAQILNLRWLFSDYVPSSWIISFRNGLWIKNVLFKKTLFILLFLLEIFLKKLKLRVKIVFKSVLWRHYSILWLPLFLLRRQLSVLFVVDFSFLSGYLFFSLLFATSLWFI